MLHGTATEGATVSVCAKDLRHMGRIFARRRHIRLSRTQGLGTHETYSGHVITCGSADTSYEAIEKAVSRHTE